MARSAKKKVDEVEEIGKPDFGRAVKIYREDIRPAQAKIGEYAQEQSTAYKALKKSCNVHPGAAKLAFKLDGMEDTKRDDFLRSFSGLLAEMNIGLTVDLVDTAEGKDAPSIIPTIEKQAVNLMSVN